VKLVDSFSRIMEGGARLFKDAWTPLLAVQFAAQPFLVGWFSSEGVNAASLVVVTEVLKLVYCFMMLRRNRNPDTDPWWRKWTLRESIKTAGLPAFTYAIQNVCMQIAYKKLDALVCNLGNQMKLFSTALWCFLLLGHRKKAQQLVALGLICLGSTLATGDDLYSKVISVGSIESVDTEAAEAAVTGIIALFAASMLSGFGAAVSEATLKTNKRNMHLFSIELGVYSLVVMFIGIMISGAVTGGTPTNFFNDWTFFTIIPALTQASGGILVGKVTQTSGSLAKCFAVIVGILLTAVARSVLDHAITLQLLCSIVLVVCGLTLYQVPLSEEPKPAKGSSNGSNGHDQTDKDKKMQ